MNKFFLLLLVGALGATAYFLTLPVPTTEKTEASIAPSAPVAVEPTEPLETTPAAQPVTPIAVEPAEPTDTAPATQPVAPVADTQPVEMEAPAMGTLPANIAGSDAKADDRSVDTAVEMDLPVITTEGTPPIEEKAIADQATTPSDTQSPTFRPPELEALSIPELPAPALSPDAQSAPIDLYAPALDDGMLQGLPPGNPGMGTN